MSTYNFDLQTNNTNLQEIHAAVINLSKQNNKLNLQEKTIIPTNEQQIVIADSGYDGLSKIIVVGDENLKSENIISGIDIFGIEGNINITNENMEDNILNKNISTYTNDRVTTIGQAAFNHCFSLTTVSFPKCSYIAIKAFNGCTKLTSISFPECTNIDEDAFAGCISLSSIAFLKCTNLAEGAFEGCSNLTSVSFPVCAYIDDYAFSKCAKLTSIDLPECTSINAAFWGCSNLISVSIPKCTNLNGTFERCSKLTDVNLPECDCLNKTFYECSNLMSISAPKCTYIDLWAFYRCTKLTNINFPECSRVSDAFENCINLTSISFPKCRYIGYNTFNSCSNLTSVSFPSCNYIDRYAFRSCYTLSQIYLMNSSICTLSNSNAFYSTPFTGYSSYFSGTPSIYVPTSLVDAYKSATNWAYFSSYISGYSELPLEPETISIGVTIDGEYVEFVSPSGYPTITVEATNEPVYCDFVLGELYNITLYGTDIAGSGEIIYDTTLEDGEIGWLFLDMQDSYATGSIVIESNIIELNFY